MGERKARLFAAALTVVVVVVAAVAAGLRSPSAAAHVPADQPLERADENSRLAHADLLEKARSGRIDVYFAGDSITRRWGATDYPELLANWRKNFTGWNAANFGWGGDRTQSILWRIEHGELDGVHPKVIVLLAGTNNVGEALRSSRGAATTADDVARGIGAIVRAMRAKAPGAVIVLMAIFPRNDHTDAPAVIDAINERIAGLADGESVRFLDVNSALSDGRGRLRDDMTVDGLHLSAKGYQALADALKPVLRELLGPPADEDDAPPPTGDPSWQGRL